MRNLSLKQFLSSGRVRARMTWLMGLFAAFHVSAASATDSVGQVSFLIGQASLIQADGKRSPLTLGAKIQVGDRVETGPTGHVHLLFIDKAAVSVRPSSALLVQSYRYSATNPSANEVRLSLERGSGRSLSGAATELDKTRFRLNTPIAAIGVRGTDFVVNTDSKGVSVTVADGAIVMTPYGENCTTTGLGPCGGDRARVLAAHMGRLSAELRPGEPGIRLVHSKDANSSVDIRSVERDGARDRRDDSMAGAKASGLLAAEPTASQLQHGNDRATAELLTLAAIRLPDLNRPSAIDGALVWGRWAISSGVNDKLTVPFSLARLNRQVVVADEEAGLFRTNVSGSSDIFQSTLQGKVEFRLTRASVSYESSTGLEAASVRAGNLTVDFNRQSFATALDLAADSGATGQLRMAGELRRDGVFSVVDSNQRIAGALSWNGKEAGYLFETGAPGALFRGRTLWRSGP
jgi:hypothetical protein